MLGGKLMFGHQDDEQTLNEQAMAVTTDQSQAGNDQNTTSAPVVLSSQDDHSTTDDNSNSQSIGGDPVDDLASSTANQDNDELLNIKQQALSQLSPIVNHLDQTPEEKFRTTMMMIQASDDQSLIKTAYEAAQQISDEKQKAQALLDIVNEINYFTHPVIEN